MLYTDQWGPCRGLLQYTLAIVNHSDKHYVNGDCQTNGIDSFWGLFKRGYRGAYHQMSKKHLQGYVQECAFRINCKDQDLKDRFADRVQGTTDSPQLPHKQLIP